jgi:pimeloyl-ACP methyl ester carboxylesterase
VDARHPVRLLGQQQPEVPRVPTFQSDGITIAYETYGEGAPVLCIHGFGSSGIVNWVETGWVSALTDAGYRAITIDNRGHGRSEKLYEPALYHPQLMAGDGARLLDHLGVPGAAVIGYSMGARIAAFLCRGRSDLVTCSVWGGMGLNLVTGLEDSEEIIAGLLAPSLADVPTRTGRQFRIFADRTKADRRALAACMKTSRDPMAEAEVRAITTPVLVVTGSEDAMAGPADALAALLRHGESFTIPNRDHMRSTGDPAFKRATLAFLETHRSRLRQT